MTRKCVSDENYGNLQRKLGELARRIDEGTLEYGSNLKMLQMAIEGKLFDHIRNGGLVISKKLPVDIKYPIGDQLFTNLREVCAKSVNVSNFFPPDTRNWRADVQFAYFEFFGGQQPSSKDILNSLQRMGYRPLSAIELFCLVCSRKHVEQISTLAGLPRGEVRLVALGNPVASKVLNVDFDCILTPEFSLDSAMQPWWPYCHRFPVVSHRTEQYSALDS